MAAKAQPLSPDAQDQTAPAGTGFENTLVAILSGAIEAHRAGNLADAETAYRRALEMAPDHPHALHFLGVVEHQKGNSEAAIALIRQAIDKLPDFADAYSNLGAAFHALGHLAEAEESFRRAAELKPDLPEAHSNLAAVLMERGKKAAAIESYKAAHAIAPGEPRFVKRLGDLYLDAEDFGDAIKWFEKFYGMVADGGDVNSTAEVSSNIGYAHERLGQVEQALTWYERAVALFPDSPEINNNLGSVLGKLNRQEEADACFLKAVRMDPSKWQDLSNLAGTYVNRLELDRAIPLYEQMVGKEPDSARLFNDYGIALAAAGRYRDAEEKFRRAIELDPDFAEAYNSLGSNVLRQGRRPEAIDLFKKAIDLKPRYIGPHVNVCHALAHERRLDEAYVYAQAVLLLEDYQPAYSSNPNKVFRQVCDFDAIESLGDPWENNAQMRIADYSANFLEMLVVADDEEKVGRLVELHRAWGHDVSSRVRGGPLPPVPARSPGAKLKIGLMSSDLRNHSVAKFVQPILRNCDADRFEFYCYSPFEEVGDQVQARIRSLVSEFRIVDNVSERQFAELIRGDGIDILFEMNGFTRDTRLKVLAYRPAPVQIFWLGYPFTSGIPEVDYILLDPLVKSANEGWFTEKPLLMPESWVCFGEFTPEPISETIPLERNGAITFGSMNNPYKLTREIIALWCRIMDRVPGSRFLYVRPELSSAVLCNNLISEFGSHGIGPERLFLVNNWRTGLSHFSYYDEIDITLDTFPVTGGTTTCDALWMGVPVISKVGPGMHQRLSYSIMTNAGLQELCMESDEDYIEKAVALAGEPECLQLLRRELRPALRSSALGRSEDFARHFFALMSEVAERHGLR